MGRFKDCRVLVLGDMMLDEYVYGETTRISREAPVLILKHDRTVSLPGGGANPVSNVHSLGGRATALGVLGSDAAGRSLRGIFRDKGLDTSGLVDVSGRATPVKSRILAGGINTAKQQVIRIDKLDDKPISRAAEDLVLAALERELPRAQGLIVSDYGAGLVTDRVLAHVNGLRRRHPRLVLCVDSRWRLMDYRGVTVVVPNETEAAPAAGFEEYREEWLGRIGRKLLAAIGARMVLVTQGSKGMTLFERGGGQRHLPVFGSTDIVDVNGAGDSVAAAMTLALCAGATPAQAMTLANAAGAVAVMQAGPASVTASQVLSVLKAE